MSIKLHTGNIHPLQIQSFRLDLLRSLLNPGRKMQSLDNAFSDYVTGGLLPPHLTCPKGNCRVKLNNTSMEVPQWNYQMLSLHGEAFVNSGRRIFQLILSACFWMLRGSPLRDQTSSPRDSSSLNHLPPKRPLAGVRPISLLSRHRLFLYAALI